MTYQRKEVIGDCTLYLADCLDVLPMIDEVESVVTDPVWPNCPDGLLAGSEDPYLLWDKTLSVMPACRRMVVVMRSDSDPRFLGEITLPFFRIQILPYVMPGYIGRKLGGDEIAYCFGDPIAFLPGQQVIPGYAPKEQPSGRKANGHPCSRAQGHFNWLIRWWSERRETVLDPFMGSGTTGVACVNLGRKFIGIELDPDYFEIACQRIEDAYKQPRLFDEPQPIPEQEQLL